MIGQIAYTSRLDRTTFLMNSSLDPKTPSAPVIQIGPSRDPYQPRFSDLLRTKWNRALERGVGSVQSTDWISVAAGIKEGGQGIVRKISGEVEDHQPVQRAEEGGKRIVRELQREAGEIAQETEQATEGLFDRVKSAVKEARETTAAAAEDAGRTLKRAVVEVKEDSVDLAHIVKDKVVEKEHEIESAIKENKRQREEYHEGVLKGTTGMGIISAAAEDLGKESFTGGAAAKVRAKRQAEASFGGRLV